MRAGSISAGEVTVRLAVLVALCGAIGVERQARDQVAGLRTHVLVGLGAGLFTLVSVYGFAASPTGRIDPTRIAAQVVSGIGFLGAGVILRHGVTVRGVTTAAALWVSAAIGMATAVGFYAGAVATTAITLVTLVAFRRLKPVVKRKMGTETLSLQLQLVRGASIRSLLGELRRGNLQVEGLESELLNDGSERVSFDVRGKAPLDVDGILSSMSSLDEVARIDLATVNPVDMDVDQEDALNDQADRSDRRRFRRPARGGREIARLGRDSSLR